MQSDVFLIFYDVTVLLDIRKWWYFNIRKNQFGQLNNEFRLYKAYAGRRIIMRLQNDTQVNYLKIFISECTGYVSLVHARTGKEYNLTNKCELKRAIDAMREDYNDQLELFTSNREDTTRMLTLMHLLKHAPKTAPAEMNEAAEDIRKIA